MVYKKFIKRGGKIYGPYVYHSRRENGVVVTEYQGKSFSSRKKLITLSVFVFSVIILLTLFFILQLNNTISTGRVTLQFDSESFKAGVIDGVLKLSLQNGELIPADSDVTVRQGDKTWSYQLSELISDNYTSGTFYVTGSDVSGEGYGYGVKGVKTNYPEVSFNLLISSNNLNDS